MIRYGTRAKLGKPLITSNTAAFWHSLRLSGIEDRMEGFGQLLARH